MDTPGTIVIAVVERLSSVNDALGRELYEAALLGFQAAMIKNGPGFIFVQRERSFPMLPSIGHTIGCVQGLRPCYPAESRQRGTFNVFG